MEKKNKLINSERDSYLCRVEEFDSDEEDRKQDSILASLSELEEIARTKKLHIPLTDITEKQLNEIVKATAELKDSKTVRDLTELECEQSFRNIDENLRILESIPHEALSKLCVSVQDNLPKDKDNANQSQDTNITQSSAGINFKENSPPNASAPVLELPAEAFALLSKMIPEDFTGFEEPMSSNQQNLPQQPPN